MVENLIKKIDNPEKYYLGFESMFIKKICDDETEKFEDLPSFAGESGEEPLTLKDVSDKYGEDASSITLYCETYTSGAVFRYNNYGEKEWVQIGKLAGFA